MTNLSKKLFAAMALVLILGSNAAYAAGSTEGDPGVGASSSSSDTGGGHEGGDGLAERNDPTVAEPTPRTMGTDMADEAIFEDGLDMAKVRSNS